jgi:hypothetical protein
VQRVIGQMHYMLPVKNMDPAIATAHALTLLAVSFYKPGQFLKR